MHNFFSAPPFRSDISLGLLHDSVRNDQLRILYGMVWLFPPLSPFFHHILASLLVSLYLIFGLFLYRMVFLVGRLNIEDE